MKVSSVKMLAVLNVRNYFFPFSYDYSDVSEITSFSKTNSNKELVRQVSCLERRFAFGKAAFANETGY